MLAKIFLLYFLQCYSVLLYYVLYNFVYLPFVGIMNKKIGIDQALEYILEPGSDSKLSELSNSESEEKPTLQLPSRIEDDEIKDTNANTNNPSGESLNEENMSHLPDQTNEKNHVFRWRSKPPLAITYSKGKFLLSLIWIMMKHH